MSVNFEKFKKVVESETAEKLGLNPEGWFNDYGDGNMELEPVTVEPDDSITQEEYDEFVNLFGKNELVEDFGGEGQGDSYYNVFHFPNANIWIQFDGYYASHYGSEYQNMFEVEPKEVKVIQYEQVK